MSFVAVVVKALCDGSEKLGVDEKDPRDLGERVDGSFLVCVAVLWALFLLGWWEER